ncbi:MULTISPECIES: BCCT family transporter [unclassified Carboxylicivirga]|uniref:BCCT family transporter n=1 Tax=Carboxylicivirga TaxID=1628153 RepID=UPI003D33239D
MKQKYKRSDKRTFLGIKANGPVFIISLLIIAALVVTTLWIGDPMEQYFSQIQTAVANNTGWFFILVINVLLLFAVYIGLSKFGKIRLGGKDAQPEFSTKGWYSMLFSAGMGIGLLFWSVAEPVLHFNSNPLIDNADQVEAAKSAMGITFLHYGLHVWGLYAIVGLALAFFTFNRKLPLTIRSVFHPLLGDKIYGPIGDAIDIISVIATIFGLATTLGLGVQQVNAGLDHLFGIAISTNTQIILIILITAVATLSLVLGLDKGVRRLSEWNMRLAVGLLIFMIIVGPTVFVFKSFVQNVGHYISEFFELSFWTETYSGVNDTKHWQSSWSVFYWAWWIAWSPFVGLFIARISKGRTIKEFVFGVLLVPTILSFFWMSVFGGSAIYQELMGSHLVTEAVNENVATAIYKLLEQYPIANASSFLAILLVISFFITSSDSGSMVVDTLTSGGRHDAPVGQKVFWASMEGIVAAILIVGGGLTALQTASILTGLPFAMLLIVLCFSFHKSLNAYYNEHFTKLK